MMPLGASIRWTLIQAFTELKVSSWRIWEVIEIFHNEYLSLISQWNGFNCALQLGKFTFDCIFRWIHGSYVSSWRVCVFFFAIDWWWWWSFLFFVLVKERSEKVTHNSSLIQQLKTNIEVVCIEANESLNNIEPAL